MYARRRRGYFLLMGGCLVLFVSAWAFVRIWSVPAAIVLCLIAMVIPPIAAFVGNTWEKDDRWWDEPPEDRAAHEAHESDAWLDELERRKRR
ncbi:MULTISPECIES: DUF3099 domain-containing protein [unclassified Streptomyces]|uniref:DUF3099 domain-containing protein n=1 Tax=unclassified Streptomyces TaxID=2593676 RepID=UPI00380559D6